MTPHEFHEHAVTYFNERYRLLRDVSFAEERPEPLRDHADEASRRCRFCGLGPGETTFNEDAHAVPEFLGNRRLLSLNECDPCNSEFGIGGGIEDQLGKWSTLARAVGQVPRKKGGPPTFKNKGLRVETVDGGLHIHVPSPASTEEFLESGIPDEIVLEEDTESPPYVPILAAKALVKIACSLVPAAELPQVRFAIEWIKGRNKTRLNPLPVFLAVTPGIGGDALNGVRLLKRKGDGAEPYLWCVVRFRHFQLQTFVPFCPADAGWLREDAPSTGTLTYFPSPFGPDWVRGPTVYSQGDWSGETPVRKTMKASIRIERLISVTSRLRGPA